MRLRARVWALLILLLPLGFAVGEAARIGWPEAVARLASERSKAEICVAFLKRYGDETQKSRGQLNYAKAKSDFDAVIDGLIAALAQNGNPESLPSLGVRLERGASALAEFCNEVDVLVPGTSGEKAFFFEIAKEAIGPLIKALSEGVAALYNNYRKDTALTRQTIQTQLEAAKWPSFAEVKRAQ
jgi:hypothetical protein